MPPSLRDMVVVLPGITGSVLQKDGRDVWNISGGAVWNLFSSFGSSLQDLTLTADDDPTLDDLGDGVRATSLMADAHIVPGLVKIDGYSTLSHLITENFVVTRGSLDATDNTAANFFEFPYDWRRDNRVAARQLQRLIERRLPVWREASGAADAKVILIGHSMGGLIARHYLEMLDGWRNCRALITFGTPYRGSVKALNFLANGYKELFLDLTEMMRSFTSVYQLLPIFEVITNGDKFSRVAEVDSLPNVSRERAAAALKFHRDIENAVTEHRQDAHYLNGGYKIIPVVGIKQPTLMSATLSDGVISVAETLPPNIDPALAGGDGTVPFASAIPIELSDDFRESYIAESHGSLQTNKGVLDDLRARLTTMNFQNEIIGDFKDLDFNEPAAIGLRLDDIYRAGEEIVIHARIENFNVFPQTLIARIAPVGDAPQSPIETSFQKMADGWQLTLPSLPPNLYRIEVRTGVGSPNAPSPVHNLFEVIPKSASHM